MQAARQPEHSSSDYLKLQAILENAVDAIITIDELGMILSVNPAATALFQYEPRELLGNNVRMLMPAPYRREHDGYIQNYLTSGIPKIIGSGREAVGCRKDGSTFPIHLAVSEIVFDGRRIFTGIVRDITESKEAESQLARLNDQLEIRIRQKTDELRAAQAELVKREKLATLGQVSGGIAHEIRNPLHAIATSAYYLRNARHAPEEKKKEHLERISRQVALIDNVVTALSDVARLPDPHFSPIALELLLAQVVREITLPANVRVELQAPVGLPPVQADPHQIPIVFRNLLRNVRDAMPAGGTITVRAEVRGEWIGVSVTDTGDGIAADTGAKVFEPFYSTKARGMGLGLAICKAIVEKGGGRLSFRSEIGQGSTFTVELRATSTPTSESRADAEGGGNPS